MDTDITGEPKELSHRVYRRFKQRQRERMVALRKTYDNDTIVKLDRVIQRDLGLDLREQVLSRLWGDSTAPARRYKALVTLRQAPHTARAGTMDAGWRQAQAEKVDRVNVALMRRAGLRALERLRPTLEGREGVKVRRALWLTRSLAVETDAATLVELAERDDVANVAHDKQMIMICLDASRPLIRADQVENNLNIIGRGVRVAVLDTGVDFTHPALAAVMGGQFDFTGTGVGDLHGHGTHCAGVVASNDRTRRGIAPGVVLSDYKHLDASGSGSASGGIAAIQQSVTDGIAVSSNSWGASHANGLWTCPDGTCVFCTAANAAVAVGQIFVVAAGNDNNDSCATYDTHLGCPGNAADVITVGGSTKSDGLYDSSSLGPTPDGRAKPDIVAPGVDIVSARSSIGSDMDGQAPVVDGIWCEATGTSMSTPHVSGVAALMLQRNAALTPAQIKSVLMSTAVNIGGTPDEMGSGRVDAFAAVSAV
jgi:serine protease AprX